METAALNNSQRSLAKMNLAASNQAMSAFNEAQLKLIAPKAHQIELRGSIQIYESGEGAYTTAPIKVVTKADGSNVAYGLCVAAKVLKRPVDDLLDLPAKDANQVALEALRFLTD